MMALPYAATLFFLLTALFRPITVAFALPPLPSSFYGTVHWHGENLPQDTLIQAVIGDQIVAECLTLIYENESVYAIDIPGDDPATQATEGGVEGDLIRFKVGGQFAHETAIWQGGVNVQLNLTIKSTTETAAPQPTPSHQFTQTPTSTNTPVRSVTPRQTEVVTQTSFQEEAEPVTLSLDSTDEGSITGQVNTAIPTSTSTQANFHHTATVEDEALLRVTSIPQPTLTAESRDPPQEEPINRSRTWGSISLTSLSIAGSLCVFWIALRKIKRK